MPTGVESGRAESVEAAMWYRQEPNSRLWSSVYPSKYSEAPKPQEDDRWKEERDRKVKEERLRPKESLQKDESAKEARRAGHSWPPRSSTGAGRRRAEPPRVQRHALGHDAELPRLPASYYASSYGGKVVAGEDGEKPSRSSPSVKLSSEAKDLDLLQLHDSQYKSKSLSIQDSKTPHERERERKGGRPATLLALATHQSHHHLGYPLYDLSYPSGTLDWPASMPLSHVTGSSEEAFLFP
ncbi:zinc finger protein 609 [Oreochromis niloticus]|uniref:zinc finger protein 609 n=1 Tax=Oreochromis niloticus TaxID=8128 RepID=UPI0009047202|nr:zinc finger protein 609 [Oreochromis niloticus]